MDLIELWVFKETRAESTAKHTGLAFYSKNKNQWHRIDFGPTKDNDSMLSSVSSSVPKSSRSCPYTETSEDIHTMKGIEAKHLAATFSINWETWIRIIADHFLPEKYDVLFNNCRHYCEKVFHSLSEEEDVKVSDDAFALIRRTKRNDVLVGTGVAVGTVALLVSAAAWLFGGSNTAPRTSKDDQDEDD
jgi:hypothetical protein